MLETFLFNPQPSQLVQISQCCTSVNTPDDLLSLMFFLYQQWNYSSLIVSEFMTLICLHDSSHSLHSASSCFWLRPVKRSRDEQDASVWTGRSAEREKHGAAVTWSHDSASQTAFSLSRRRVVTAQFWFWVQDVCSELSASNHLQAFLVSPSSPEIL